LKTIDITNDIENEKLNLKKILIITNHYLPGYKAGGPIKSVSLLCENLENTFNITVMTSNHDSGELESYKNIEYDKVIHHNKYNIVYLSKINIKSISKKINFLNPDVIYLNSFYSKLTRTVLLLKKLKFIKAKIILAPRGELSEGALSIKSKKKSIFIKLIKIINLYDKDITFHATDKIEKEDIKKLFSNNVIEIENLTTKSNKAVADIKKQTGKLKIIFLSRISRKKNLLYGLKVLKKVDNVNIIFDIYGTKEDMGYWTECHKVIKEFNHLKIVFKGPVKPIDIPKVLNQYHLFFLPTKNENFGHAIVESMQSGLIPLISDQTPWNDLERYNAGYSLNLVKKDVFVKAINCVLDYNQEDFLEKSNNVKRYIDEKLDYEASVNKYIEMFSGLSK
jgi:glycosyltransferase involved in cell wall biosynthesis